MHGDNAIGDIAVLDDNWGRLYTVSGADGDLEFLWK